MAIASDERKLFGWFDTEATSTQSEPAPKTRTLVRDHTQRNFWIGWVVLIVGGYAAVSAGIQLYRPPSRQEIAARTSVQPEPTFAPRPPAPTQVPKATPVPAQRTN